MYADDREALWLLEGWTQADQEVAAPEYYPPSGHAAPTQRIFASNASGGVDDLSVPGPKNSRRGEKVWALVPPFMSRMLLCKPS